MAEISLPFESYRQRLIQAVQRFLSEKQVVWADHYWGVDVVDRLEKYVSRGKLLRGSMILLAYQLYGGQDMQRVEPAAVAMELIHSGLLIHDDIIDRDQLRRGQLALHTQYQEVAVSKHYALPEHQGQSLALCVGDMAFFMSFELLQSIEVQADRKQAASQLLARELSLVGLAEMQDVHQALTHDPVTEQEVLFLYRYKTGRYTFSLPLMMGALLAGADKEQVSQLEYLGEVLGLIFQLKDDELGLFGSVAEIGKPIISDIREGKKTLYYLYGLEMVEGSEKEFLQQTFGNREVTEADVEIVKKILDSRGVVARVNQVIAQHKREAEQLINDLDVDAKTKQLLQEFVAYNLLRRN